MEAKYTIPISAAGTVRNGGKRIPVPPFEAAKLSSAYPRYRLRIARMNASNVAPTSDHIADDWEELVWFTVIL
jgi:hypothetical protein